jgi:hypothetical protein
VQSTLRNACAIHAPDSHSAVNLADARTAAHSATAPDTSTLAYHFAASDSLPASLSL